VDLLADLDGRLPDGAEGSIDPWLGDIGTGPHCSTDPGRTTVVVT